MPKTRARRDGQRINRGYNATIEDHKNKLAYDLFYIKNVSIGLDIYILFATLKILLLGRGGRQISYDV